jgi:tetratricopeptide (TPR) repeat protein
MTDDQLTLSIDTARAAAQQGDFATAVETQARVVIQLRLRAQSADDLLALGAQMFNLADYYTGLEQWAEAIRWLEEVVSLDEKIGHPDIESDRQALAQVRRLAGMTPAARRQFYANTPQSEPTATYMADPVEDLISQLESLSPEERTEVAALMREMKGLSAAELLRRVRDRKT